MMNVIETVKTLLTESNVLDAFNGGIHVDYTEAADSDAGLYSTGPVKIGEDVIGNPKYRMNFQLYTGLRGFTDYDRQVNSDAMTALTYYLDSKRGSAVDEAVNGKTYSGKILSVTASNAMLYDVPSGDYADGVRYQLQIAVEYKIRTEE